MTALVARTFSTLYIYLDIVWLLLLTGICPAGIVPLLVNSLIETNMGMPYLYLIHRAVSGRIDEDLAYRDANPARS